MKRVLFALALIFFIGGAASGESLCEALDTNLIMTTGGSQNWLAQTDSYVNGGDAAASGDITHNEVSWMQTTVVGDGMLSFYWKVSSEENYDLLEFYIDGVFKDKISGSKDWHQMTYTISSSGPHTLQWRYVKDENMDAGDDGGWVDLVEWSGSAKPPLLSSLSKALDTSMDLTTWGQAEWFSQNDTAFCDGDAAQSGDVEDNQESCLEMAVEGAGTVSFYWKVSSEENYDLLEFYIDGVLQDQISGVVDWHQMDYTIVEPGTHILQWRYVKDESIDREEDAGWVDLLEWSGSAKAHLLSPLCRALDTSMNVTTGGDAKWFSHSDVVFFEEDAARSGDVGNNEESFLQMTIEGAGTLSFYWKVSSEENYDKLEFYIDGELQDVISGTVDLEKMMYTIAEPGSHILEWRYIKDESIDRGEDAGWVDLVEWSDSTESPVLSALSEALDTSMEMVKGGAAEWFSQGDAAFFGGDAAQSGDVEDYQESFLQTTIDGAGTVSFYWKVSSEAGYDFLEFYIDGQLQDRISGTVDWQKMMYTIAGSGLHTLEWRYIKDGTESAGDDAGWLDKFEWLRSDGADWWVEIQ
jgi:hypothetical protein